MSPRAVNDNEAFDESASEKKENTTLYGDDELELVERTVQFRTDDSRASNSRAQRILDNSSNSLRAPERIEQRTAGSKNAFSISQVNIVAPESPRKREPVLHRKAQSKQ